MRGRTVWACSGGFCLLLVCLLFWDDDNIVPWALLSCAIHECGHVLAIRLLGGRVAKVRLSVVGAEMTPVRANMFSYREELLIAVAGPLFSLLAALLWATPPARVLFGERALLIAGLNLAAGLFNLLPTGPLDGGRILRITLLHVCSIHTGEVVFLWISRGLSLLLMTIGFMYMQRLGGNVTLLLTASWLLWGEMGGRSNLPGRQERTRRKQRTARRG